MARPYSRRRNSSRFLIQGGNLRFQGSTVGGEVTLLDHTCAYSVRANSDNMAGKPLPAEEIQSGYRTLNPVSMLQVRDSDGNILKKYEQSAAERIFSAEVAYLMQDITSDDNARASAFGANTALTLPDRKVAAKTGTTNGFKDKYTMGFTPQMTVGVWVGNTDNESMENATGLTGAAPIWNAVIQKKECPPPGTTARRALWAAKSARPAACCSLTTARTSGQRSSSPALSRPFPTTPGRCLTSTARPAKSCPTPVPGHGRLPILPLHL